MPRQKKDAQPISIKMDKATFDRLEAYCERAGQSKTVAIERALNKLIDEYDDMVETYESRKAGGLTSKYRSTGEPGKLWKKP